MGMKYVGKGLENCWRSECDVCNAWHGNGLVGFEETRKNTIQDGWMFLEFINEMFRHYTKIVSLLRVDRDMIVCSTCAKGSLESIVKNFLAKIEYRRAKDQAGFYARLKTGNFVI
jgi:hypothetical protein